MGTASRKKISICWLPEKNNAVDENSYFELFYNTSEFRELLYLGTLALRNMATVVERVVVVEL